MKYPKFEKAIQERIVQPDAHRRNAPSKAMVLNYDRVSNTAQIMTVRPGSEQTHEIYNRVPCPQSSGVQTVSPEFGRMCWISFPGGSLNTPVITSFFSPNHSTTDYEKHSVAKNDLPHFMRRL